LYKLYKESEGIFAAVLGVEAMRCNTSPQQQSQSLIPQVRHKTQVVYTRLVKNADEY
jgi:hypothetical protein